jgi:hypothetical protein
MPENMNDLELELTLYVRNAHMGQGSIQLHQTFPMRECSFSDLSQIMAQFHDLFEAIKRQKAKTL